MCVRPCPLLTPALPAERALGRVSALRDQEGIATATRVVAGDEEVLALGDAGVGDIDTAKRHRQRALREQAHAQEDLAGGPPRHTPRDAAHRQVAAPLPADEVA